MTTRKQYSKQFKLDAISLVQEQGYSKSEAARSLGINANVLGRWIKEHESQRGLPGHSVYYAYEHRIGLTRAGIGVIAFALSCRSIQRFPEYYRGETYLKIMTSSSPAEPRANS
jgi:hypothetical protein